METEEQKEEEPGIETPEPGIYADVDDKYYRAWRAISITTAFWLTKSPGHYLHRLRNPPPASDPMQFGTNFHTMLLQPEVWKEKAVVMPDFATGLCDPKGVPYKAPKLTNLYKEKVAGFEQAHRDKTIIDQDTAERLEAMKAEVMRRDVAAALICGEGEAELSVLARDPASNLICKGRLDKFDREEATLIDLKTVGKFASPTDFAKTVAQNGYYIQMAHYVEIAALCGLEIKNVIFIAVESKPPYGVGVYSLPPEGLEAGKRHRRMLLDILDRCHRLNDWPLYEDEIRPLVFDRWSFSSVEDALED